MSGDDDNASGGAQSAAVAPAPAADVKPALKDEPATAPMEDVKPTLSEPPPPPPALPTPTDTLPPPPEHMGASLEDAATMPPPDDASVRPLNVTDALGYLDCVKQQFADQSDVYNRFLDIMKDFKSQLIDTPGVIERVSTLFRGYPQLIQGFNTFLPAGYRIECTTDGDNSDLITVTTPSGTTTQAIREHLPPRPSLLGDLVIAAPGAVDTEQDIKRALQYVQRVKNRYANDPHKYKAFLEVLSPEEGAGEDVLSLVERLFKDDEDLKQGFYQFLPDRNLQQRTVARLDDMEEGTPLHLESRHSRKKADGASSSVAAKGGSTSVPQKRKRKPAEKDKGEQEKDKHKDIAPKPGPSKRTKQQHITSEAPSPSLAQLHAIPASPSRAHALAGQLHPSLSHTQMHPVPNGLSTSHLAPAPRYDDAQFFDRVKRALENRDTYNEFLKLVNLFTQDIIDTARLVREARNYLGDGELMAQFKDILGWDERRERYAGSEDVWTRPTGVLDRPSRNQLNLRHGSYRKLPVGETDVMCSGRDEMCKAVLNDHWVSQPTFHSEDAGFLAHKKNAYEEALHRSEEERHEYDFHIEAIHRTIQALEPFNSKISQMSQIEKERETYKYRPQFQGAAKSIHLRVIKKVYGREAGVEVFQAMQEVPVVAIPLVLQRLKQKHDEWKRAQREWNKVWKEVDARNYYKSLDHQGITFKAADKKALTHKAFVSQIEAARDEQLAQRAALVDPLFARTRPRHQLEYVLEDPDVLQDALKLACSFLDRTQGQIGHQDRRRIEQFLRGFVPLFLMADAQTFNAAFVPKHDTGDFDAGDPDVTMDDGDAASVSSRGARPSKAGSDLRKRLLKSEQAKSSRRTRAQDAASPASSRPASPALGDVPLPDREASPVLNGQGPSPPTSPTDSRPMRKGTFFTNTHFYVLVRLLEVLYSRLRLFKDLAAEAASEPSVPLKPNPLADRLGMLADVTKLGDRAHDAAHFYELLLESCERLFDGELEQGVFEEQLRYMFGIQHAYKMFTVDKVVGAVVKQVQTILADTKSMELFEQLRRERDIPRPTTQQLINFRRAAEKILGPDENLFRMVWVPESKTVTIQLLGKDDASFDDSEVQTGRWQAYMDSYVSPGDTAGLTLSVTRKPFIKRTLKPCEDDNIEGDDALAIRVCTRTYRLFYVAGTEDLLWRPRSADEVAEAARRLQAHNTRKRAWLEKFTTKKEQPAESTSAVQTPAQPQPPAPAPAPAQSDRPTPAPAASPTAATPKSTGS
ncbi:histone deacetylase complex, regulatory component SIN3 [Phanerochaete sordida]|uniref:Histone deacetylase complex, regulatory component SIN3 n=1 Tax=Phanerochaete sordida TaxID=48140 RepID=A0A9P3LGE3_9APHY|nr:histone deacetylase complex, regulatory component SIN3 [Phanerochaete sordida]